MVPFAHNHMQMGLACALCVADSLLKNVFCFLDELTMQIDSVACDFSDGIVFTEDLLRGLLVVLVGLCSMFLALFA